MPITREDILYFTALISILLNIYFGYELTQMTPQDEASYGCPEVQLGGTELETNEAKRLVDDYANIHKTPEIRGFYFSKRAFVDIFSDNDAPNGINFYLTGTFPNSLRLIMRGTRSVNTAITCDYDNHIFVSQSACPYDCAQW